MIIKSQLKTSYEKTLGALLFLLYL